jgi:phage gp46-like protein
MTDFLSDEWLLNRAKEIAEVNKKWHGYDGEAPPEIMGEVVATFLATSALLHYDPSDLILSLMVTMPDKAFSMVKDIHASVFGESNEVS